MADRSPTRNLLIPLRALVGGAVVGGLALGTFALPSDAAAPGPVPAAAALPAASTTTVARPATATTAAPLVTPSCQPWQTATTVPAGVTLTPRVFPDDALGTTAAPPTASGLSTTTAAPKPPRRIVCRNAAPTPFAAPAWDPDTVVGGPALAASGVVTALGAGAPAPPEVFDVSYVVADLGTGEILAAKSPHAWLRPASTLKTLTALTLMPRLDPRKKVVATDDAQAAEGTRVGIIAGNPYPVGNLFDALLMFSANDAAYALADAAGGYDRTVGLMNAEAARIGAHDTVTVDPSGLDEGNQRSSAYDLALIGRAAMRLPAFRATVVKRNAMFPGGTDENDKKWPAFQIYNINPLLTHYAGAVGVKPGRTNRAQHTFIGAATRGGRTLIVAQMGSVTGAWQPTAALLDWGFANAARVRPVGRLVDPGEARPPVRATISPTPLATSPSTSAATATATLTATPTAPTVSGASTGAPAVASGATSGADSGTHTVVAVVMGTAWLGVLAGAVLLVRRLTSRRRTRPQEPDHG